MGFLQPVGCRFMVFLIWLLKEMGPYYVILCLRGLYTTEANSLVSSFIHVFHNYFWLTTMYWDWARHVDTMMTNRVSAF